MRGGAPSTCASGSHDSQPGRYQFHFPSSFMPAGTSTARTMVASIRRATATPSDTEIIARRRAASLASFSGRHTMFHPRSAGPATFGFR
jgi:hypothetical protein